MRDCVKIKLLICVDICDIAFGHCTAFIVFVLGYAGCCSGVS